MCSHSVQFGKMAGHSLTAQLELAAGSESVMLIRDGVNNLSVSEMSNSSEENSTRDVCNTLPKEMLMHILSYLDPVELCRVVAPVCRAWYDCAYDPTLWRVLNVDRCPDISSLLLYWTTRRMLCVQTLIMHRRATLDAVSVLSKCFPQLREVDLGFSDGVTKHVLEVLVQNCPKLERVNVEVNIKGEVNPNNVQKAMGCIFPLHKLFLYRVYTCDLYVK
jgi:hypothetical protein